MSLVRTSALMCKGLTKLLTSNLIDYFKRKLILEDTSVELKDLDSKFDALYTDNAKTDAGNYSATVTLTLTPSEGTG